VREPSDFAPLLKRREKTRKLLVVFPVMGCLLLVLMCATHKEEKKPEASSENGFSHANSAGIVLKWKADTLEFLHAKVSAPTTGWVAVGFHPTDEMKDANIIIGYVKDGDVYVTDEFGVGKYSHLPDTLLGGEDNVTNRAGAETVGRTEISFTIPLDSGDPYDRPLAVGKSYMVMLAYGPDDADDFQTRHERRTHLNVKL